MRSEEAFAGKVERAGSAAESSLHHRNDPNQAWQKALKEERSKLRPAPEEKLLNLHFGLHISRRVSSANTVEFLGRSWKIAPTARKTALIVHHPNKHFWVTSPAKSPAAWPDVLASNSL